MEVRERRGLWGGRGVVMREGFCWATNLYYMFVILWLGLGH